MLALDEVDEEEDPLRSEAGSFCWIRAMKPGILSLDEGVGWT